MTDFDCYDEYRFSVHSMIEQHGFAVQYVMGEEYSRGVGLSPDDFSAIQLVWATPSGHFPWDPECSTRWRLMQPILEEGGRMAA
jgi:hypothetical protein